MARGKAIPEAVRAKAIAEHARRKAAGEKLEGIGKMFGIGEKTVNDWVKKAPKPKAEAREPKNESWRNRPRKQHSIELRQQVVEAYVTRAPGVQAKDIAEKYGVSVSLVGQWHSQTRNGKLAPLPRAEEPESPMQLVMRELEPVNGHKLDVSVSSGPTNGLSLLQLRMMQLEAENKRFRKIIHLLMEQV